MADAVMETVTMTLTEFLLAHIAADESLARSAIESGTDYFLDTHKPDAANAGEVWARLNVERWTPARVLAECEAKRRIVALHGGDDDPEGCAPWGRRADEPCDTLCALALPYADHPDYREAWKS